MGLFRKTLAVSSAIIAPGTSRNGQPGFIKYRSEAEEARREQTALLRQIAGQSAPGVSQATGRQASLKTAGESWCCRECRNHGCDKTMKSYVHWTTADKCECTTHHAEGAI